MLLSKIYKLNIKSKIMNIREMVANSRKVYFDEVKPLINKGEYETAYFQMGNLIFMMDERSREIVMNVHCGLSYIASAKLLHVALLEKNPERINRRVRSFEVFLAQTKLPLFQNFKTLPSDVR